MLVVDANVVVTVCAADAFSIFGREQLVAPPVMWSEARSALRTQHWRGEIHDDFARTALDRLEASPITPRAPRELGTTAWEIAVAFGWAKTYDAEYVALARLLRCRLVTADEAMWRATRRLGYVIRLQDL